MPTILSLVGIIISLIPLYNSIRVKKEYITTFNIVMLLMIVDIYLPAIIGNITGDYYSIPYVKPLMDKEVSIAVLIIIISNILLIIGYYLNNRHPRKSGFNYVINKKWLYFFFYFSIIITLYKLYLDYKSFGDFIAFFEFKIARAYLVTVENESSIYSLVNVLSELSQTIRFMVIGIAMTHRDLFSKRDITILLTLTILLCLIGLSRGAFLTLFVSIIASIEYTSRNGFSPLLKKRIKIIAAIGIAAFVLYGGLRKSFTNEYWEAEDYGFVANAITSVKKSTGASLIAIVRCLRYVESGSPLFNGESYSGMFLSFVPRSVMPNKPKIYGVEILTIAQGSPDTTMDAVTMPGEAIMNFGYIGLIIMVIWGGIFKWLDKLKYYPRMKYFLAAEVFSLASTSNWMAFTGLFAQLKYLLFYYIVLLLIVKIKKNEKTNNYVWRTR